MIQWNSIPTAYTGNMGTGYYNIPTVPYATKVQNFQYLPFGKLTTSAINIPAITPIPQGITNYTNPFGGWFNFSLPSFSSFTLSSIKFPTFNLRKTWRNIKTRASRFYNSAKKTASKIAIGIGNGMMKIAGYCASSGRKLAQAALNGSAGKFLHKCATYVKNAICKVFPGIGYKYGVNGCDIADAYKKTGKFKEISAKGIDLKKLPAGCILCYEKGVAGYSGKYGHTEITLGNGKAVSDGITRNIRPGARILIPIA